MAVDERARHELYEQLTEVLGAEATGTLMEMLPPGGWANVATKDDLARLEARIDARFAGVDGRFDNLDSRFDSLKSRFDNLDSRFDDLDSRLDSLDSRFDSRFQGIDWRFETVETKIEASRDAVIAVVRGELNAAITSQTRTMIFTMAGMIVALGGLALTLARF